MATSSGPSFIGIGASYAGLPQVVSWLGEHPEISDHVRAYNFFNTSHFERHGYTWYEAQIEATKPSKGLIGDCSAGYLTHTETPERIVRRYPQAKLFALVRHPLDRALAAYEAAKQTDQQARKKTATEYLASQPHLQTDGWYADALYHYFSYYSPLQLHVIVYEDLVANPLKEMSVLYDFLGVDKNFIPKNLSQFAPPPDEPKHPSLLYRGRRVIQKLYRRVFPVQVLPLFPSHAEFQSLQTEAERAIFLQSFAQKTKPLANYLGRDMVAFWELET
jgi:hypothetical protein